MLDTVDPLAEALYEEYARIQAGNDAIPDWYLKALARAKDEQAAATSSQPAPAAQAAPAPQAERFTAAEAEAVPDWLAEEAVAEPALPGDIPDWLRGIAEPETPAVVETPDWLSQATAQPTEAAAPADLPDWLMPTAEPAPATPVVVKSAEPSPEPVKRPEPAPVAPPHRPAAQLKTATSTQPALPAPAISAQDVRFTAFHPKEVVVETWYTLLVYAHIEASLRKVQADAAKFKEEMGLASREVRSAIAAKLARGTEITIIPSSDGVEFNPKYATFNWIEDLHRSEFRLRANQDLADSAGNILAEIYVGPLLIATIKGGILFNAESEMPAIHHMAMHAQTTASMYKAEQIFPSYSHSDEEIVIACRNAYKAIGFEFLRDRDLLRPGEAWNETLRKMIDRADIFQLFWSENASNSDYVRQEWEYALQQNKAKGGSFIRPVYWQQPMAAPPTELSNLHFIYMPRMKADLPT